MELGERYALGHEMDLWSRTLRAEFNIGILPIGLNALPDVDRVNPDESFTKLRDSALVVHFIRQSRLSGNPFTCITQIIGRNC